jgi:hypothetical protein
MSAEDAAGKLFKQLKCDSDGGVSKEKFRDLIDRIREDRGLGPVRDIGFEKRWAKFSTDGNDTISMDEMVAKFEEIKAKFMAKMSEADPAILFEAGAGNIDFRFSVRGLADLNDDEIDQKVQWVLA